MRRMYSKEQLQKLIDEVSRLIAIEELDKVVPVPSLADAGKVMIVNAQGTGYQLAEAQPTLLEDIEDSDGHKRFIEGAITENPNTGYSHQYARWSLSGSHLMIVDAIKYAANTDSQNYKKLGTLTIPSWLGAKLFPLGDGTEDWLCVNPTTASKSNASLSSITKAFMLRKVSNTTLEVYLIENINEAEDLYFRIAFDLLIDNA
ncbi:MAG: hypothetical protein J6S85_18195 [Methanobrevibacter sp.]|nr:hypothetical protein [Methanobrevibacter sp.]